MPEFLVFQLFGNLASWGDIAVGEHRPAHAQPSKSAISGLLGAALGIKRDEDELHLSINNRYGIAIFVQHQGEVLRDYHTTQVPAGKKGWPTRKDELTFDTLNLKTILSQRDYQMDAFYLVALWSKTDAPPFTFNELKNALRQPKFTTSLGRKSCPACLPFQPEIVEGKTLKEAFNSYPADEIFKTPTAQGSLKSWYWEAGLSNEELGMKAMMSYPRRDQVRSRSRWQFANRNEYYYSEDQQGEN